MADQVLLNVVNDIKESESKIADAQKYIDILREAGEPVSQQQADLTKVKERLAKWKTMLKTRGIA